MRCPHCAAAIPEVLAFVHAPCWKRTGSACNACTHSAGTERTAPVSASAASIHRYARVRSKRPKGKPGEQLSYEDARAAASRGRSALVRDRVTQTMHATQPNGDQLWVNDAELVRTLIGVVRSLGVHRVSLWRLGQEDPALWRPGVVPER